MPQPYVSSMSAAPPPNGSTWGRACYWGQSLNRPWLHLLARCGTRECKPNPVKVKVQQLFVLLVLLGVGSFDKLITPQPTQNHKNQ